ncbi:MAG: cell surface protein SprA, partial [Bacteroidetes bacterium]
MTGFYLSYYFRNRWEDAHEDPPNIRVEPVFERITEIEVWRLQPTRPEELNVRQVVAMIDLGEESDELVGPDADPPGYTNTVLPDNSNDSYDEESGEIDQFLRNGDASPGSWLEENKNLTSSDYQIGKFKRLDQGQDYTLDPVLGYITLNSRLQESEALAVAYRYRTNGTTVQIGDFSTETGGSDGGQSETKLVLKLLRPVQLRQPARDGSFNPAAWYLEMRNLYSLSTGGVQPADFELQIYYEPPGQTSTKTLPGLNSSKTLLQLLNWDRVNADGALLPDDVFDFLVDYTIRPARGNLIFPVLEPFGTHMEKLIAESDLPEETREQLRRLYVFTALYREKKANARKDSQHDVFRIQGVSKGSVKAYYDLRAFAGIVPGSVRVTSGGTPLRETVDYVVDYSGGTLTITNSAYLISGRQIQIDYEQNSLFNVRKKTLLGLRADYTPSQNFQFGATVMTMKEKSPSDKFRIGDEPISNMIWGADASLNFEPRWLTSGIDMIPLLQTREPSRINVSGEFAQLRPNHVETQAFKRTEDRLADLGRSFSTDEQNGTSFIDDFEGFENVFSLMQPGSWNLASAPDSIGAIDRNGILPGVLGDSLRTNWRSGFAWYRINASTLQELPIIVYNDDPEPIQILEITDVYPTRDVQGQFGSTLETLDLYMNPFERGQYNYTGDLRGFLDNPKDTWGGMIHRLPEGFTDFSIKNIDFVEFVIRLFPENPARDAGRSAHLYIDLGRISEDVIPDEKLNNEDGLSMFEISESSIGKWARLPNSTQNSVIDIEDNTKRTEDLGLDGLASYGGDYPPYATEAVHFKAFLDSFDLSDPDPVYRAEVAKAMADPSGDDFQYYGNERYFGNTEFFPRPPYLQERFSKYFPSYELNGFETQSELAENTTSPRGNSRYPDSEDQNTNSTIDIDNSYFQYELTLSSIALDSLARPEETNDYVVGEITDENGVGNGWYQIRIPVKDFTRKVGSIQDFSQIESIRVWTAGHDVPITMRFASLELVGSQWQESERVLIESDGAGGPDEDESNRLTISSINNEENADVYIPPIGTIIGETRLPTGVIQESREQSLLLRKKMLLPGRQRGIFRTQNTALDLLKYSNLRMFVHMHGRTLDGRSLESLPKDEGRSKASLFVRLGANENNDYYEYEQPLTPSSETSGDADDLWQTNVDYEGMFQDLNSMNIELGAFNQLKVARDRLAFPTDSIFYNVVNGIPTAPDVPDAELFAPPGTRLGIKGNPSLGRINSIVIGIRNASDSTSTDFGDILEEITVWLNELRVSGYDETNGWAAVGNADIKLADIGNIRASIRSQTDGFGSLSSSLDEREQNNIDDWSVTTDIRANKLIPDRYNWSIPLSVQYASNTSTPRFSPTRGDVRLDEILSQINDRDDLSEEEKQVAEEQAILAAQTHSTTRSFSGRVSKSNSGSGFLRTTIDGVALTYSSAATEARTPALQVNNSNRWNSTLSYQYRGQAYTVKPLWLLQKIPFLGPIGRLQLNYAPQSVQTSASLKRNFSNSRDRPVVSAADTSTVPLIVRFPNREKHTFTHTRNFGLRYNPFQFLNLSFDYNTGQSFNQAGVDTLTSVAIGDTLYPGYSIDEAIDAGLIDEDDRSDAYEVKSLTMIPATQVLAEAIKGSSEIRTEVNDQSFTASFRPRFTNINALNWIQIQDITYSAKFRWKNGAINRNIGAGIDNTVTLRAGATVRIQDLFRKFGFYRSIERRQNEFTARKA